MGNRVNRSAQATGYLVALVASCTALLLRFLLADFLGSKAPFFTFVLAVLITAWYSGFRAGLLATILGAALGTHFFVRPLNSSWTGQSDTATTVSLFLLIGATASFLCGALHTARRRVEEKQGQLVLAEEQILSVVNHILDAVITIDGHGNIHSMNPAGEKLFGYRSAEVIGKNVNMLMPEPYRSEHDDYLAAYERTGQAKIIGIGREVVGQRKDGSVFPMDLAVSEFRTKQGRFFTGIVHDITDRKQSEAALKESSRRKDEFLATLAHELRNPLAPMRSALELMRVAGKDSDAMERVRGLMERQLAHLVRLVDDLLDMSRITSGKLLLRKEKVHLANVVQAAIESASPFIEARRHELTVRLPQHLICLDGDLTRLAQVFSNLLTNAAKYTENGGVIELSAECIGHEAVISVRDTGIGIPAEHLPNVFEMFSQAAPALERSQGGLGIGLSLVRGLVELHGGSIEARSEGQGKGSEFVVHLPASAPSPQSAPPPQKEDRATVLAACRVLIVDDNRDAADSLATVLKLKGHEVCTAYDGLEAIQMAESFRPEALFLDIGLPKLNGYETARRIRQLSWGKKTLLIALTGWGQEEDRQQALQAGFDHHLRKPAEPLEIQELLGHAKKCAQF